SMIRCSRAHPRRLHRLAFGCVTLAVVCSATNVRAQTGQVTGVVFDKTTAQPLEASQVLIPGTRLATATDRSGRFVIRGVTPGSVTIRAQRLGFRPATQVVQ